MPSTHPVSHAHHVASALACSLLMAGGVAQSGAQSPNDEPPNIVFIFVDDLGWMDVGFNGGEIADTPNLDRFAAEGMKFTHAYAPAPICSASRAAILTGRSPARLHYEFVTRHPHANRLEPDQPLQPPPITLNLPLSEMTIPEVIAPAGYTSAFMGKWHVSAHYDRTYLQWSPTHGPMAQGFDTEVFDFGMHPYGHRLADPPPAETFADGEFPEDSLTERAVEFLLDAKDDPPFFLMLSHFYVHDPVRNQIQWLTDKYTERLGPEEDPVRAEYAASVEIMDHHIGRVLESIDDAGIRESTLVVFFSDNGGDPRYTRHAPLRGHKWTLYEGGVRVPMAVRWPGVVEPDTTCDVPVIGMDLLPTFAEAAGVSLDPTITLDGVSIVGLLKGDRTAVPTARPLLFHFPYYHGKGRMENPPTVAGINDPVDPVLGPHSSILEWPWKLIYWYETEDAELFNLDNDIGEQDNLAQSHEVMHDELMRNLNRMLEDADARLPTR